MPERILILPDTHYPIHDKRLWKATLEIVQDYQPDSIIHIGDLMDYPQPSRWTKGTKEEFEGSVFEESDRAIREIIEPLRRVYTGPIGVHEGNHDARPRLYMEKYAPALAGDHFNFENLLRFDDFGITRLPDFNNVAPGWISTHGHLGGIRLNQKPGMTALNAAIRVGKSIIMGHTHRAGISANTQGLDGSVNSLWGVEVGHIIDPKKVGYLRGATGNWQQSLATLTVEGKHVTPRLIPVSSGRLSNNERIYRI